MAEAKRRSYTNPDGVRTYEYYCSNCDEWFQPKNPRKPDFPTYCKGCNTRLKYE